MMDFGRERARDLVRPGLEQKARDFVRKLHGADEGGNGGHDDEKRKHRHEDRQGDMACDRPAVVAIEAIEGIEENMQALANDAHCADASADGLPINRYVIRAGCEAVGQSHWAPEST